MLKSATPNAAQLAYRKALEAAMQAHGAALDASELLAVTSHLVGQIIALQDQRAMTPAMAMELVQSNIEAGNLSVFENLLRAPVGGHT